MTSLLRLLMIILNHRRCYISRSLSSSYVLHL